MAADTVPPTGSQRSPWLWALPAVLIVLVTLVLGIVRYPSMPEHLAMHYDAAGRPNRTAVKSVGSAFLLLYVQLFVTILIVGLVSLAFRTRAGVSAAAPSASVVTDRRSFQPIAKAMLVLAAGVDLILLLISWSMWRNATPSRLVLVIAPVAVVLITLACFIATARASGTGDSSATGATRDDDALWRGGMMYVNRDDPAVFVPKRFGGGWTLNFGRLSAIMLMGVILVFVLGLLIVLLAVAG